MTIARILTAMFAGGSWNINTGTYASKSLSLTGQGTIPGESVFNPGGTTMLIVASSNSTIYQYTLSTPFDISTASYAGKSLSANAQDNSICGLSISPDGTKLYVSGAQHGAVYQYTLPTPFDLASASYASKSMSTATQDVFPEGIYMTSDGTKLFVLGDSSDTVYQYTLSTPFDVSTGSYASKSMSVSAQGTQVFGFSMSVDGTKAYMSDNVGHNVYQYGLTTPFDISTGSYASKLLSIGGQDSQPRGLSFKPDGLSLFVSGALNNKVFQYTLT